MSLWHHCHVNPPCRWPSPPAPQRAVALHLVDAEGPTLAADGVDSTHGHDHLPVDVDDARISHNHSRELALVAVDTFYAFSCSSANRCCSRNDRL